MSASPLREHALPLRVVQTREPVLRLLESRTRAQRPVVLLKYCYVDINSPGDPATMFEAYRDTVDTIQFEHPDVTVVHTTIPLDLKARCQRAAAEALLDVLSDVIEAA